MTRIILHGGYGGSWDNAGEDFALFQKLADAAKEADGKVMISFLAFEKPTDFPHLDQLLETFQKINPNIAITITGPDNFQELLPQHKVLFLQGGKAQQHFQALSRYVKNDLLKNKALIAGSSSGAMVLCNWGYSRSSNGPLQGKSIVDYALMPHANAWPVQDYLPKLREVTTSSILLLNEMQIIELQVD